MIVILSYFHAKIGPKIFYSFPKKKLDKEISARIFDIMDQPNKEEFLTQSVENLKLLNYYFQIYSEWARGDEEMIMVSVTINQQISPEIEENIINLCKKFSERLQSNKDIYPGFHTKELYKYDDNDKERIRKNEFLIKNWVQELYWEIIEDTIKISEEEKINLLSDDRYIFESLEKMAREVKKISDEISVSDNSLKTNSNIKVAISNLHNIIDDLYEGYIEKMTEIDIEDESGLFSTEEEIETDIQKSRKALIRVLEGEVARDKE
jgi:hypothetical protein